MTTPRWTAALLALALVTTACGGDDTATESTSSAASPLDLTDWDSVLAAADGQTVDWWLYGGDARINAYLDDHVVPAAAELGVTLRRVPIDDTAEAVQRVAGEIEAGVNDGGAVDMIWINGENFAAGQEAGLWLADWAQALPNARFLDEADPTLTTDFGRDTLGMESPWNRAAFIYAHDPQTVPDPPTSVVALLDWIRANPGRFTYPAPPDFTGSAFVRQVVQALGEEAAFTALAEIEPLLWREGTAHPVDAAELDELFSNGEVDLTMSYNPAFVAGEVENGRFDARVRPFAMTDGTLSNVSFVTIPANAGDVAGALVVAHLLLDPLLQALKADPGVLGIPTVLNLSSLTPAAVEQFTGGGDRTHILDDFGVFLAEIDAAEVDRLEARWLEEVL